MPEVNIKTTHKPIKTYYAELEEYAELGAENEGSVRAAFQSLLQHYCGQSNFTLLCEKTLHTADNRRITPDGEVVDTYGLPYGYWEAKDTQDDQHVNYESQPEYDNLKLVQNPNVPLNWRVEKMKLSKDKTALVYNNFLTLDGIPAKAFEYRLGTRSALEWVINQYCVKTDKRSGIVNDPNRADDPQYIVQLLRQVITVSLETVDIVGGLPALQ